MSTVKLQTKSGRPIPPYIDQLHTPPGRAGNTGIPYWLALVVTPHPRAAYPLQSAQILSTVTTFSEKHIAFTH
jgi:hypothetical protein